MLWVISQYVYEYCYAGPLSNAYGDSIHTGSGTAVHDLMNPLALPSRPINIQNSDIHWRPGEKLIHRTDSNRRYIPAMQVEGPRQVTTTHRAGLSLPGSSSCTHLPRPSNDCENKPTGHILDFMAPIEPVVHSILQKTDRCRSNTLPSLGSAPSLLPPEPLVDLALDNVAGPSISPRSYKIHFEFPSVLFPKDKVRNSQLNTT